MPEVGLNREFLHRSCVQLSAPLDDDAALEAEKLHILRFVRVHANEHASEVARSLIWRIVDTDDANDKDRVGAWTVLNAVLVECGDGSNDLSRTPLAEKVSLFLPYLIAHRWYSPMGSPTTTVEGALPITSHGKVVPASVINGDAHLVMDVHRSRELTRLYRQFLLAWKEVWRSDVFQRLKEAARATERAGNHLSSKAASYLEVPATFKDSLWRLRRKTPRPSIALHVLYCYGWAPQTAPTTNNNIVRPKGLLLPKSMSDIESLDSTMQPGVKGWLRRLIEAKGGCRLCDTWRHEEARCPCELPFLRSPVEETGGRRRYAELRAPSLSYMEAVEKLYRYGIKLPLRVEKALDRITQLIQEELPYEEVLTALDVVRGAITGPLERHALWLHAGYSLLPSKTLFDKPSDDALSPALEKAERHFKSHRRFREWDQLLQSVEVLDGPFRRHALPAVALQQLEEIRETCSFFFCLIDGSLPASFTPGRYARVPEEVVAVAPLKDILCHVCLEPFHFAANCPKGSTELWDLQVARLVLEDNSLLTLSYPEEMYKLDEALHRIDEDERQAKEFRKCELSLAVKLVHEAREPICSECNVVGHTTRRCVAHAKRVLAREHIREVDMRLDPKVVQRRLRDHQGGSQDIEYRELRDAYELLARGANSYPFSYAAAIRELDDARIPLAAARYSTDAVQGFLLFISSSDLLQHLLPFRDEAFPEVCLFCDSYHHRGEECERAREDEKGFLAELRRCGLDLWQYLRTPDYYDERLPTDYASGKGSIVGLVRQFEEDYGPGGVARQRFMEHNGLENTVAATQGAGLNVSGVSQKYAGQRSSLYGPSFSQLRQPERPEAEVEEEGNVSPNAESFLLHGLSLGEKIGAKRARAASISTGI